MFVTLFAPKVLAGLINTKSLYETVNIVHSLQIMSSAPTCNSLQAARKLPIKKKLY